MCGITGIFGKGAHTALEAVEHAALLQQHRGPDFFKISHSENFCFAHNRLSVIDLSSRSNQPLEDDDGILIYNGEIYYYRPLCTDYLDESVSVSDTTVLFSLLKKKGEDAIPLLNGMFAFAFYDKRKNVLLLSRDRMGIKPIYYAEADNMLLFSSEIKSLLYLLGSRNGYDRIEDCNREFIENIVVYGHAEFQTTPFHTLHELPPGTIMKGDGTVGSFDIFHFFSPSERIAGRKKEFISGIPLRSCVEQLDSLLCSSVKMHLISDAPVGILCSGGVDSSLITAIAAGYNNNIAVYHAAAEGEKGELPYAETVARKYKLKIHSVFMNENSFLDSLVDVIYHLDVPMYHPSDVSLFAIAEKAHSHGVKALLCGEGADELFGGYRWHIQFGKTVKNFRLLTKLTAMSDLFFRAMKLFRFPDAFTPEELFFYSGNYLTYNNQNVPLFSKRNAFLRNRQSWELLDTLRNAYEDMDSNPALASFCTSNLFGHLSTLLQRNDRMCMMASIESRVPFLENNIIDFALILDSRYKIRGTCGKYIIKKVAERYLPREVIYRKKAGFPVPWQRYIKRVNPDFFRNGFICDYFSARYEDLEIWCRNDINLLYTALSLEIWGRLYCREESPSSVREALR
jgi:asparagine synthase (glutamine-hydrolysing)